MNKKMLLLIALVISANNAMSMEEGGKQEIDENQEIEINQAQPTQFSIKNSVVTIFGSSANKVRKVIGLKNITQESEKDFNNNIKCLSGIKSAEDFIYDWDNNSVLSNKPSYIKKSVDRSYNYQFKVINNIYEMQKQKSFDVQKLNDTKNFLTRFDAYQKALYNACKIQLALIENRINEALEKNDENNNK